jgi:hypothetical protein
VTTILRCDACAAVAVAREADRLGWTTVLSMRAERHYCSDHAPVEHSPSAADWTRPRLDAAAQALGLPRGALWSRARDRQTVAIRHAACRLLHEAGLSYPAIGAMLDRDHTTVLHGARSARPADVRALRLALDADGQTEMFA